MKGFAFPRVIGLHIELSVIMRFLVIIVSVIALVMFVVIVLVIEFSVIVMAL